MTNLTNEKVCNDRLRLPHGNLMLTAIVSADRRRIGQVSESHWTFGETDSVDSSLDYQCNKVCLLHWPNTRDGDQVEVAVNLMTIGYPSCVFPSATKLNGSAEKRKLSCTGPLQSRTQSHAVNGYPQRIII